MCMIRCGGVIRMVCMRHLIKILFYRGMDQEDLAILRGTGKLRGTVETTISPKREFSESYGDALVKFNMKPGTGEALEQIGVRDDSVLAAEAYPDMPSPRSSKKDEVRKMQDLNVKGIR